MNIILGISGSIAAYKSAILTRLLVKEGHDVKIIMTDAAQSFISPLTLSTLSKNKIETDLFEDGTWNNHVELGLWADLFLIAPATATTISKMANGLADNMLVATYLSAKCPVFLAPAMDLDMWKHGSTLKNLQLLESYGDTIIPVGHGELASGLVGDGRMAEPEQILQLVTSQSDQVKDLEGKNILVTAGPTYEDIDPVRFIGNNSSGRMGIEIAEEASRRGAIVTLVLGPSNLTVSTTVANVVRVRNAEEMFQECIKVFDKTDVAIMAAAVGDYTPLSKSTLKLKKGDGALNIELKRTKDIAATLGLQKKNNQLMVGFSLETNNAEENAKKKLEKKNFDFIVLNSLEDEGAGFQHQTNKVKFIFKNAPTRNFDLKTKKKVAKDIIDQVVELF